MVKDGMTGRRIANYRRERGLSQRELARLIDRSETWVSQVERGVRRIDRMSVLDRVAGALGVPVNALHPNAPTAAITPQPDGNGPLTAILRGSSPATLAALAARADEKAPDPATVAPVVERAWRDVHAIDALAANKLLATAIPALEAAVPQHGPAALVSLASAYQAATAALNQLSESTLATIAGERAIAAARLLGDAPLMAAGVWRLSLLLPAEPARQLMTETASALHPWLDDSAAVTTLYGAFVFRLAMLAARLGDYDEAMRQLGEAETLANQLGTDRTDFHLEFGPISLAVHDVRIAVALGDAGRAVRKIGDIPVTKLSLETQATFWIDVARAHAQLRDVEAGVAALERARALEAPTLRDQIRELVQQLSAFDDGSSNALRQYMRARYH